MSEPYYSDELVTLYHGRWQDSYGEWWAAADVLVTDPPYGRAWRQGDTGSGRGWASDRHDGIVNDEGTAERDWLLSSWGDGPAIVFGDLMLAPPENVRHVLIYDKGVSAGFTGAVGGYRRNVEAIYLLGLGHGSGLGGRSAILTTTASTGGNLARTTGHPHTKPVDLMAAIIEHGPDGVIVDPFAGSGSTLVAARSLGRRSIGVEVDERYCETIAKRLSQGILFGASR